MNIATHPQRGGNGIRKALALAVLSALCAAQAAVAAPSPAAVATSTPLGSRDAVLGALPTQQPLHVVVALKLRNKDALDAFVAAQAKDAAAKPMSSAQVLANHMPTRQQAQAVADYLSGMGFRNVRISANHLLVKADGTAESAGRAFLTSFRQVRMHDGRVAFANVDDAHVPAALADKVQSVFGLQNVYQAHTFVTTPRPLHIASRKQARADGSAHTMVTGHYYYGDEFSTIYGGSSVPWATSITAGIISEGDLTQTLSDLNQFTDDASLPRATTSVIAIDGVTSTDTSGTTEWNLDSQDIVGAAGGQVHQLNFYNMADMTNGSLVDAFNQAVTDNVARVINVSLGECETGAKGAGGADAADAIFEVAVAQGQTFSVSTGDSGADECPTDGKTTKIPSWPANSQYVVAVAGTNLDAGVPATMPKVWAAEIEWTNSGGSESKYEPKPSWQTLWTGTHRGVADVAFDGDPNTGAAIYIGNGSGGAGYYVAGGTSLSAPIFTGLWSRVLQHRVVGFAGPIIYNLQAADFHDITSGSNGIPAAVGYDLASGRGSLILSSVIADIDANDLGNHTPVSGFSFSSTGLTTSFTDSSTDADGAGDIVLRSWDFGDSLTGSGPHPTHAFGANGAYSVTETVTDKVGATASISHVVNVAALQVVVNPHFDWATHGPWGMSTGVLQFDGSQARTSTGYARLGGGSGANTNHAQQTVTIPTGVTTAKLVYYVKTTTADTGTVANDKLKVQVYNGTTLLGTPDTVSNLNASAGYVRRTADMTPYIGQTVLVKFFASNDATLTTTWNVDDVTLNGN